MTEFNDDALTNEWEMIDLAHASDVKIPKVLLGDPEEHSFTIVSPRNGNEFGTDTEALAAGACFATLTRPVQLNLQLYEGKPSLNPTPSIGYTSDEVYVCVTPEELDEDLLRFGVDRAIWAGCLLSDAIQGGYRGVDAATQIQSERNVKAGFGIAASVILSELAMITTSDIRPSIAAFVVAFAAGVSYVKKDVGRQQIEPRILPQINNMALEMAYRYPVLYRVA